MTSKESLIHLVKFGQSFKPELTIEFAPGSIILKGGKYTHRQGYMTGSEEDACLRMLEAIFLGGVFGHPEFKSKVES